MSSPCTRLVAFLLATVPASAQTTFDVDRSLSFSSPLGLLTEGFPGPPAGAIPHFALGLVQADDIDALSFGDDTALAATTHTLIFSPDFQASGVAGSGMSFETSTDTAPGSPPAAAGDLFVQSSSGNALAPPGLGYDAGSTDGDEANAAWGTPCNFGLCDDLDAFEYSDPASASGVYFSLAAGSPTLGGIGASPGDVLYSDLSGAPPVVATLAGGLPATAANLGIAGLELDALNLIGTTGPVASGGGVIAAGNVGKNIAGVATPTSHLIQYSIEAGFGLDAAVLVLSTPGTFAVHTDESLLGMTPNENLNALEAISCSPFLATVFTYNGTGINLDTYTAEPVVVGAPWASTIQPQATRAAGAWIVLVRTTSSAGPSFDLGTFLTLPPAGISELLVGPGVITTIFTAPPHGGGGSTATNVTNIPNNCALVGNAWFAQAVVFGDLPAGAGALDPWFSSAAGGIVGTY